jgi:hypothetical protein
MRWDTADHRQREESEKWNDIRFEITPGKEIEFLAKLSDSP